MKIFQILTAGVVSAFLLLFNPGQAQAELDSVTLSKYEQVELVSTTALKLEYAQTCVPTASLGCGEHGAGAYQGGGYNPIMVLATVCLPSDIWREVQAGGGNWDLNFAYPRLRLNERIQTVNGQCITRRMPLEYDTMAAAYIRCSIYTGVVAVLVSAGVSAYQNGTGAAMLRRPDMNS